MIMTYTAERTAEMNEVADYIAATAIGDGVSVSVWSDVHAYTVIKKTATTMTLRADRAELTNRDELRFVVGGFAAHCENQEVQCYEYAPEPNGHQVKISLRCWKDEEGNERRKWKRVGVRTFEAGGNVYPGRRAFRDFNF
jgi:hypothetical protein